MEQCVSILSSIAFAVGRFVSPKTTFRPNVDQSNRCIWLDEGHFPRSPILPAPGHIATTSRCVQSQPHRTVRRNRVHRAPRSFRFAQECFNLLASQVEITANEGRNPLRLVDDVSLGAAAGCEARSPTRA